MKNILFVLFFFISISCFAQDININDYQYVVIPAKFEVQDEPNQYRLNTLAKKYLTDAGFTAFHESLLPAEVVNQNCNNLYMDFIKSKSLLTVKAKIVFKDCRNKIVFSAEGSSREKDYAKGYTTALAQAFEAVKALDYQYNGKNMSQSPAPALMPQKETTPPPAPNQTDTQALGTRETKTTSTPVSSATPLSVEVLANGYLLIDSSTSRIVLKMQKTGDPKTFLATNSAGQGVVVYRDGKWVYEHYKDDQLVSEVLHVQYNF